MPAWLFAEPVTARERKGQCPGWQVQEEWERMCTLYPIPSSALHSCAGEDYFKVCYFG